MYVQLGAAWERYCYEVDWYARHCARSAGSGLPDHMIPYYREQFFEDYDEFVEVAGAHESFVEHFRVGWDNYRYSKAD